MDTAYSCNRRNHVHIICACVALSVSLVLSGQYGMWCSKFVSTHILNTIVGPSNTLDL